MIFRSPFLFSIAFLLALSSLSHASEPDKLNMSAKLQDPVIYKDASFESLLVIDKFSGPEAFNATVKLCSQNFISFEASEPGGPGSLGATFSYARENDNGIFDCIIIKINADGWENGERYSAALNGKFADDDTFISKISQVWGPDYSNYLAAEDYSLGISQGIKSVSKTEGKFYLAHKPDTLNGKKAVVVFPSTWSCLKAHQKPGCDLMVHAYELSKALYFEGYDVTMMDLENVSNWGDSKTGNITEASGFFHKKIWENISENDVTKGTYVVLLGSEDIVPPCVYEDDLEGGEALSDYCYASRTGAGRPEAAVSRMMPLYDNWANVYETGEYHIHRNMSAPCFGKSDCFLSVRMKDVSKENVFADFDGSEYVPPLDSLPFLSSLFNKTEFFSACKNISVLDGKVSSVHSPIQFYFLHSSPENTRWSDSEGNLVISNGFRTYANPIIFSSACYGGVMSDRNSIPWGAMGGAQFPGAFIGAKSVSYFGGVPGLPVGSDLLSQKFYENLRKGETAGEALLHAKQWLYDYDYKKQSLSNEIVGVFDYAFLGDRVSKMNKKTVFIFDMYGDPTLSAWEICGDYDGQ